MKHSINNWIFIVLYLLISLPCIGQLGVSKSLALQAVLQNSNQIKSDSLFYRDLQLTSPPDNYALTETDTTLVEEVSLTDSAKLYLIPAETGWFLISSSQKTNVVFAYFPTSEKPILNNFSPTALELIKSFEREIILSTQTSVHEDWLDVIQHRAPRSSRPSVAPLLTKSNYENNWGQTTPKEGSCDRIYNKFCPEITSAQHQCYKAAVGCVAVAIGQIMWYWEYPQMARVPITVRSNQFVLKNYDWTKMPYVIDNSVPMDEVDQIAGFLRDCGYQTRMNYGTQSGSNIVYAQSALATFGYNIETMRTINKNDYNNDDWKELILNELLNGRPIYYQGFEESNIGHAFVIDGYKYKWISGGDLYHINWGWRGDDNAYYRLGRFKTYNTNQKAIIGIEPLCGPRNFSNFTVSNTPFSIVHGDDLTLGNVTIQSNAIGEIHSPTQIRLNPGFVVRQGSDVRISIDDVNCPLSQNRSSHLRGRAHNANEYIQTDLPSLPSANPLIHVSPNPVMDILHIESAEDIISAEVYSMMGNHILSSTYPDINVSSLPIGTYILYVKLASGEQHTLFVKQ